MHIFSFPDSIRKIVTLLFVSGIASFLFAQEGDSDLTANRGYFEYHRAPETKKGTVIFSAAYPYSAGNIFSESQKEGLSDLQKKARLYRYQGLELQRIGSIAAVMNLYKKAIELDPDYAVAYNDLGVIYETKGYPDLAEQNYLTALSIDPCYLSAYSNLALLYENKNQFDKAAFYWGRRIELGCAGDPWTEKAKKHLENIRLSSPDTADMSDEQKIIRLIEEAIDQAGNPE